MQMVKLLFFNRARIASFHDVVMATVSFPLSLYMRVGEGAFSLAADYLVPGTIAFAIVAAVVFRRCRLYRGVWRYASMNDMLAIVKAVSLTVLLFLPLLFLLTRMEDVPRSLPFINWLILVLLLGGPRFAYRLFKDRGVNLVLENTNHVRVPVLLIGAGDATELFIRQQHRDANAPYRVVGVVDEKGTRIGREIHGVPVLGGIDEIEALVTGKTRPRGWIRPQRLVLTNEKVDGTQVRDLLVVAERLGLTLARLPKPGRLSGVEEKISVQPIAVEDVLGRSQTVLDRQPLSQLVIGRQILVTGAGGSIGAELVRQIAELAPAGISLLDNGEFALYQIDLELAERYPDLPRTVILGDIRDRLRVLGVLEREKPDVVFHAAALKHVPMVEANPMEGVLTNAVGTRNVADACIAADVKLMVQISTDKVVDPSSVMGATKRLAESYCQALDLAGEKLGRTKFVTVRFGNVLGSTGSVIPLFQRQLAAGGPLTVTHPDVTRYFMTIREAVELVLLASALGLRNTNASGKIFVLDMGEPVKILDLARQVIRLAGHKPDEDIKIKITGLRPGEKLAETLLHAAEELMSTDADGLMLAAPRVADLATLSSAFDELEKAARDRQRAQTLALIHTLVPEYTADIETSATVSP
jgi:O-antigen biosynthesis protein WbqV